MRLYWTGTDSLMLIDYSKRTFRKKVYWQLFRWWIKFAEYFIQGHIATNSQIKHNLVRFGFRKPIEIRETPIEAKVYPKRRHDKFTILYYYPTLDNNLEEEFKDWLYANDIAWFVLSELTFHYKIIEVNGTEDMSEIYPYVDFYLRPNRHDESSRMIRECKANKISYYWSVTNPDPAEAVKQIEKAYQQWKRTQ